MAVLLKKYKTKAGKNVAYLYQDDRGYFWVRKRFGDQTPRKSLETNSETIAITKIYQALEDLKAEALELQKKKRQNKLVKDFYLTMIEQKTARDIKPSTLERIDRIWRNSLDEYWGSLTANEIDDKQVTAFINWHKKKNPGVQLVNVFKYLGNIFRIMVKSGELPGNKRPELILPANEVKHHKTPKGRFIEEAEYAVVITNFDSRYSLILELAYELGMRKMEIGSLQVTQIKKIKGHLFIDLSAFDTKTGLARIIPIPKCCEEQLLVLKNKNKTYLFESPTDKTLHVSAGVIDDCWAAAKRAAGIEGRMRFHDLRHTRATLLVEANHNPITIATFLGMTIKTLQEKYYKIRQDALLKLIDSADRMDESRGAING